MPEELLTDPGPLQTVTLHGKGSPPTYEAALRAFLFRQEKHGESKASNSRVKSAAGQLWRFCGFKPSTLVTSLTETHLHNFLHREDVESRTNVRLWQYLKPLLDFWYGKDYVYERLSVLSEIKEVDKRVRPKKRSPRFTLAEMNQFCAWLADPATDKLFPRCQGKPLLPRNGIPVPKALRTSGIHREFWAFAVLIGRETGIYLDDIANLSGENYTEDGLKLYTRIGHHPVVLKWTPRMREAMAYVKNPEMPGLMWPYEANMGRLSTKIFKKITEKAGFYNKPFGSIQRFYVYHRARSRHLPWWEEFGGPTEGDMSA